MRRATSVKAYLDQGLSRYRFYSAHPALSRGEADAARGAVTPERMAEDRRVDILSSFIPERRVRLPEIRIQGSPPVRRVTYRRFSSTTSEGAMDVWHGGGGDRGFDRALQAIQNIVSGRETPEGSCGREVVADRRTASYPLTHRVNRVRISKDELYSSTMHATVLTSNTIVQYEWGAPADTIEVVRSVRFRSNVGDVDRRTEAATTHTRASVAGNTLFFPPDPR